MNLSSENHLLSERGTATLEFAFTSILFMFLTFATIEYGVMFSERHAITALAREGASLASRNITTDANMIDLLESTEGTLELNGHPEKYAIFLAQITGSTGPGVAPSCTATPQAGTLTHGNISPLTTANKCGLPDNLYAYLEWDTAIGAAGVSQFTVLDVHYQHVPVTPLGGTSPFLGGPGHQDTALLLSSRAIF